MTPSLGLLAVTSIPALLLIAAGPWPGEEVTTHEVAISPATTLVAPALSLPH
jgi:hypothetical protein